MLLYGKQMPGIQSAGTRAAPRNAADIGSRFPCANSLLLLELAVSHYPELLKRTVSGGLSMEDLEAFYEDSGRFAQRYPEQPAQYFRGQSSGNVVWGLEFTKCCDSASHIEPEPL